MVKILNKNNVFLKLEIKSLHIVTVRNGDFVHEIEITKILPPDRIVFLIRYKKHPYVVRTGQKSEF